MARSFTVEADGAVIPFEAPEGASPEQIRVLAARALKAAHPSKQFQRPVLERGLEQQIAPKDQGSISAAPDTLESRITGRIAGALSAFGVDEGKAQRFASKATSALSDLTPVGSAVAADEAQRDFRAGNYGQAAGNALLAAIGLVPDGGATAAKGLGALHAIIAPLWHGSPHKFEKFALEKIGTGEGAQAYGHGLYFAENRKVAEDYRNTLAGQQAIVGGQAVRNAKIGDTDEMLAALKNHFAGRDVSIPDAARRHTFSDDAADLVMEAMDEAANDPAKAIAYLRDKAENEPDRLYRTYVPIDEARQVGDAYGKAADLLASNPFGRNPGHLYEVKLDANPEDFLDWDAPLHKQANGGRIGELLQSLHRKHSEATAAIPQIDGTMGYDDYMAQAGPALETAAKMRVPWDITGEDFYRNRSLDRVQATEALRKEGIPGIRYLDQGSRYAGDGTRNYVVFDPSIIDITNRY